VPLVPGSNGTISDEDEALSVAEKIGYPVMIKAAAGGGGRGMRPAHNEATLRSNFKHARLEAEAAFKDGSLYLEKLIERPRHVEVQFLGDQRATSYTSGARLLDSAAAPEAVEESPSPHINTRTRNKLCNAAVRLAKTAGYYSAGTLRVPGGPGGEFLLHRA